MSFLFLLCLISSMCVSLALFLVEEGVINPLFYCFLGWFGVVVAYYFSDLYDRIRINLLNRNYQAYIITPDGLFWNGRLFCEEGFPKLYYNNFQVHNELKKLHKEGYSELYVRVVLSGSVCECEEEEES